MEIKEFKIQIPEGMEIDKENSTFECIRFKPIEVKKNWENIGKFAGYYINPNSLIVDCGFTYDSSMSFNRYIAASKKVAKGMLAMAKLSQVLKKWYTPFTESELRDPFVLKWGFDYDGEKLIVVRFCPVVSNINLLVFRTESDALEFLENNRELIKQYCML